MMQKNEKDLLPIFVAYYGALFGYENIYIFDNGSDAYMLDELRKSEVLGCNVSLEFSSHADFERKGEIVASYINNLTDKYDVFLPLDCDEFIGIEVPDGYSCESEDLLQGFEEINGSHGYQISQRFYNHPFKKNLFTKNLKGMRKLFFWDGGKIASSIVSNCEKNLKVLDGYDREYQVFSDMIYLDHQILIEGNTFFKQMDNDYPESLFIYNTRNIDNWIQSR